MRRENTGESVDSYFLIRKNQTVTSVCRVWMTLYIVDENKVIELLEQTPGSSTQGHLVPAELNKYVLR